MQTYPVAFRERALQLLDHGRSVAEVSTLLGVGAATLKRWRRQRRETGALTPKLKPGRPPRIGLDQHAALTAQVDAMPDATLAEHCAAWAAATGVAVSPTTMCRHLRKLNLPLKKNDSLPASGTSLPARRGAAPRRHSTRTP